MFFDARAAKQLQAGQHLVVDGCPGLRLVATESLKTWTYRYKESATGRMKQVRIGHWPAITVQAAAAAWQGLRDQRSAGIDPGRARRDERARIQAAAQPSGVCTVRRVVEAYIAGPLQGRKAAGALAGERALQRFLADAPDLAGRDAASITRADAFAVLDAQKDTPTAAAKLRSMLGAAWDLALDAGQLDGNTPNWWRQVLRGRLKSRGKIVGGEHVGPQRRLLRPQEIGALLAWLPNMHPLGRDATVMYLWTCARGAEFLAMRPEHVGRESTGWWWTVPVQQTKNARFGHAVDHRVPLFGRALEVVQRRLAAVGTSGWLFEDGRGEQYTQHDFSTYIYGLQPHSKKVSERRGDGLVLPVTGWTPHNLRRTSRTILASLGCPQEVGEAILGHLPAGIVGVYNAYTYDAERREWLQRLADYLEALAVAPDLPLRP